MSELQVSFWATIAKVQSMADSSKRIYLDLPEDATEAAAVLMEYQRFGVVAQVDIKPRENDEQQDRGTEKHTKLHI